MNFTDVPILKIWPILADTNANINIDAFLIHNHIICLQLYIVWWENGLVLKLTMGIKHT